MALFFALAFAAGGICALLALVLYVVEQRENLSSWHTTMLEEEFRADCGDETFADYLAREDRLFAELDERVYQNKEGAPPGKIHRYRKGSPADPTGYGQNWNRTFELVPAGGRPRRGVLLLHGMSDSPYSLRTLGQRLHAGGAHVVGLRLPGHGTAPSGLLTVHRRDMAEAVALAMRHLRENVGDRPIHQIGYSNGGALAVRYGIEALEDPALPKADGIVLISPAIGVSRMMGLAATMGRIGHWLGIHKLEWTSIGAEYDPYKYNSFAVNAGDQVRLLTVEIARNLDRLGAAGQLADFPPVLAFQSGVDATVSTPALIEGIFSKLPEKRNELVLFDLNRVGQIEGFLTKDPKEQLTELVVASDKPFAVTVLANRDEGSLALEERYYPGDRRSKRVTDPGLSWPGGIYSLSHVSLPFPPDDPLYGTGKTADGTYRWFHIGNAALRGEKGLFRVPAADQLRLRWNPFYGWLEERVVAFVEAKGEGRPDHP